MKILIWPHYERAWSKCAINLLYLQKRSLALVFQRETGTHTVSGLYSFSVVDTRGEESTILIDQDMHICHSLRSKQIDMSTAD